MLHEDCTATRWPSGSSPRSPADARPDRILTLTPIGRDYTMKGMTRRELLKGAAAMAAAAVAPRTVFAQAAARSAASRISLPARGEFVIRDATVLTMDPAVPDLATGEVHVRDGA